MHNNDGIVIIRGIRIPLGVYSPFYKYIHLMIYKKSRVVGKRIKFTNCLVYMLSIYQGNRELEKAGLETHN